MKCINCARFVRINEDGERVPGIPNWCFYKADSPDENMERDCIAFVSKTNGDRVRTMSDEWLANFVAFVSQDAYCYGAGMRDGMIIYPFESYESALSWMKQPVDESEVKEWEESL